MSLASWNQLNLPSNLKGDLSNVASSFDPNAASRGYSAPPPSGGKSFGSGNTQLTLPPVGPSPLVQNLIKMGIGGSITPQGNFQNISPPTPPQTTQISPGLYARQGETLAKELTQYNVPNTPPLTNPDGSDTEYGQLVKMGGGNPSQQQRMQQLLNEWRASHPVPTPTIPPAPPPTPALPPAMPPQTQVVARPVGSTATLPSIGATGAVGQKAFGATTAAGLAGKDLQTIKGLPLDLGVAPQSPSANFTQETKDWFSKLPVGEQIARNLALPAAGALAAFAPAVLPELIAAGGTKFAPQIGSFLSGAGQKLGQGVERLKNIFSSGELRAGAPITGTGIETAKEVVSPPESEAGFNPRVSGTSRAITNEQITPEGKLQFTPAQNPMATQQQLQGTIPVEQHGQVLQMYNTGQISKEDVVSAIASPEAKQSIGKMINTAVKAGDFGAAKRLADLAPAIDDQLALINQIGRAVLATSQGFGTPNAPGVTEARMPMVQMGVGQALTTPRPDFSQSPVSAQSATLAPYLRPRFDEVERNRPPIFPYFNR